MQTSGYTKLFSSLVTSTIWCESKETKILWVTMLALTTKHSMVEASVPGLAKLAGLTIEEVEASLKVMESPDPHSRTSKDEGRRIKKVEGGWFIINGDKYRNTLSQDSLREYNRIKKREYRAAGSNPSGRERRYSNALADGDQRKADRIAAEGL